MAKKNTNPKAGQEKKPVKLALCREYFVDGLNRPVGYMVVDENGPTGKLTAREVDFLQGKGFLKEVR